MWIINQEWKVTRTTNGWRVLGAEDGQLLLLSTDFVVSDYALGDFGDSGVSLLNAQCAAYGNGEYADSAKTRSINVDDINRITGYNPRNTGVYDPNQTGTGTPYGDGTMHEYGNEVTYTIEERYNEVLGDYEKGNVISGSNGEKYEFWVAMYTHYGWEGRAISTGYSYYPDTLTETRSAAHLGNVAYNMLFRDLNYWNIQYFLGSSYVSTEEVFISYGLRGVVDGKVSTIWMMDTGAVQGEAISNIRAVVYVQADAPVGSFRSNYWHLGLPS